MLNTGDHYSSETDSATTITEIVIIQWGKQIRKLIYNHNFNLCLKGENWGL